MTTRYLKQCAVEDNMMCSYELQTNWHPISIIHIYLRITYAWKRSTHIVIELRKVPKYFIDIFWRNCDAGRYYSFNYIVIVSMGYLLGSWYSSQSLIYRIYLCCILSPSYPKYAPIIFSNSNHEILDMWTTNEKRTDSHTLVYLVLWRQQKIINWANSAPLPVYIHSELALITAARHLISIPMVSDARVMDDCHSRPRHGHKYTTWLNPGRHCNNHWPLS